MHASCDSDYKNVEAERLKAIQWNRNWDHRDDEINADNNYDDKMKVKPNSKRKAVKQIVFIRHGQYDQADQSDHLQILTPLGRLQAIKTGKRLKEVSMCI